MNDALRIAELIEHGKATNVLIEEHHAGLQRAYTMRLAILQALIDCGLSQAEAARVIGMTPARSSQILTREPR